MSDEIREQVSALIDDELSDVEQPLLLGRLQRDPELRACLGRYQLIGEVMRGSRSADGLGVAEGVQRALADEAPIAAAQAGRTLWWKPLAGTAIAASVALVAVLSVSSLQQPEGPGEQLAETVTVEPEPLAAQSELARTDTDGAEVWNRIQPQVDKRLSGYLVNHNEYAASRGMQGVMPYVRIVGFDTEE